MLDYLGDAQWDESETAKTWYARMKSRPSFRPLLAERLPGMRRAWLTPISTSNALTGKSARARLRRLPGHVRRPPAQARERLAAWLARARMAT